MIEPDPDRRAIDFVEAWPRAADPDAVTFMGVNLGLAVRRSVMQAVAASLRTQAFPEAARRDAAFRAAHGLVGGEGPRPHRGPAPLLLGGLARLRMALAGPRRRGARPRILARNAGRLASVVEGLAIASAVEIVLAGPSPVAELGAAYAPVTPGRGLGRAERDAFAAALDDALGTAGFEIARAGCAAILAEADREAARIRAFLRVLERTRPDLVLLHDDASPDGLAWALAARTHGAPTLSLAHGLDCERFYLDTAHVDVKCVWGEGRAGAIRATALESTNLSGLRVTGNPAYDGLRPPDASAPGGPRWLWVTRPHTPRKCFTAGRFPVEGADIFAGLLDALKAAPAARLTIKPHPTDYADVYRRLAAESGLGDRIAFATGGMAPALDAADVVVTEDSTAALDAMLKGKPLVHAHFAPTPPALPLAPYRAALPGGDTATLRDSLLALTEADGSLFAGQRRFIDDFAGPLDGKSRARVLAEIAALAEGHAQGTN